MDALPRAPAAVQHLPEDASLVFGSYLVKHPAIPSESCTAIYTKELDTDCSSYESMFIT